MNPILAWLGGALALMAGAWPTVIRPAARIIRRAVHFLDDVAGEPARDGVPARPGVMKRLESIDNQLGDHGRRLGAIEHELHPNGGQSLRDVADRIEQAVAPDEAR